MIKRDKWSETDNFIKIDSLGRVRGIKPTENLTGKKFLKLTAIKRVYSNAKDGCVYWKCKCDCGNYKIFRSSDLKKLRINSCGCEKRKLGKIKHGLNKSKEYIAWQNIKIRCYNKKGTHYKNYGGRGILMSDSWKNSFIEFYKDMGKSPSLDYTIDRIDNNLGYYKENCRWVNRYIQANNTRNNVKITFNGTTKTLEEWARDYNINSTAISRRIKSGWTVEKALTFKGSTKGYVEYKKRNNYVG